MGREFEPLRGHQRIKQLQSVTAFFVPKKQRLYGQNDKGYVNLLVNQSPFVFYFVLTELQTKKQIVLICYIYVNILLSLHRYKYAYGCKT